LNNEHYKYPWNIRRPMESNSKQYGKLNISSSMNASWWIGWIQRMRELLCEWEYLRNSRSIQEQRTEEVGKEERWRWRSNPNQTI